MNTELEDYDPLAEGDTDPQLVAAVFRHLGQSVPTSPPSPQARDYELITPGKQNGEYDQFVLNGTQLGFGTSQHEQHRGHSNSEYMPARLGRCSACRWFEVRIIRATDPDEIGGTYVVHTHGNSIVPGEKRLCRVFITSSPYELVVFLTVRRDGHVFIPNASSLALAQASHWDDDIRNACFNHHTGMLAPLRVNTGLEPGKVATNG
ncbi:MAG: hypothetical protein A2Y75_05170 [Candidatus Solincola sediminis]|uniref:Uncharacterized protein n=1 Tax=Candidatus Solincola sediminis TaxID=1797199 RepID=A0A1F2WG17_9ACTN|nr:MAG: hypothetical protein A2Y75_05170 [Candidatus Solincola sediminis]